MNIPEIAKRVSPAVVGVATKTVSSNFFGWQFEPQEGIGSGFIFNENGTVLTNYHVIKGASEVKVIFHNGKEVSAKVVNYQEDADLAVLKITEKVEMPGVLEFGDSDALEVGEQVVAIGNPLGKEFSGSVTTGIISALNREMKFEDGKTLKLIQTDTAINPGNSGGPLIDSKGQVIGINTAKIGKQGVEGLGFSIPINEVLNKLDNLTKPTLKLGISCINLNEELAKANKLPVGIYIEKVESLSVAQKGGLQPGDVIVKFANKKVSTVKEINKIKDSYKDGDVVPVEFIRDGKTMIANLKLE
jgi:serine protease Do